MNSVLGAGKYLFAVPMAIFGLFHFMAAGDMAAAMNPPGGEISVYITGVALIAAAVSIFIGKYDKLASALLGLMLLLFALILHLKGAMDGDMSNFLKDIALAGGALMYATGHARDNSVIG